MVAGRPISYLPAVPKGNRGGNHFPTQDPMRGTQATRVTCFLTADWSATLRGRIAPRLPVLLLRRGSTGGIPGPPIMVSAQTTLGGPFLQAGWLTPQVSSQESGLAPERGLPAVPPGSRLQRASLWFQWVSPRTKTGAAPCGRHSGRGPWRDPRLHTVH